MSLPRLVIPFANAFLVRYLLHTGMLEALARFTHPIILLRWNNPILKKEIENVGADVVPLPAFQFNGAYEHLRHRVILFEKKQRKVATTNIDRRRYLALLNPAGKIKRLARDTWIDFEMKIPGHAVSVQQLEKDVFWRETNGADFERLLAQIKADVIFSITPFLPDELPLLRAAERMNLPRLTSILSFDNLSTKDPIPVIFNLYCVWNHHNADEIQHFYPVARNSRIVITGPPQFDFYTGNEFLLPRDAWMENNGIQSDSRIILFGGGVARVSPFEPRLLCQIYDAIQSGEIKKSPLLLFRKHPLDNDSARWDFQKFPEIYRDKSWNASDLNGNNLILPKEDIAHFVSTLFYSDIHINSASTLTVDGSFFDRPQIGSAYDDENGFWFDRVAQEVYKQEHFLPISQSGGLRIVRTRKELVDSINDALENPARLADGRKNIVNEICTFTDGCSTQRVVRAIADYLGVVGQ
jgi:hypothetical protein